MTTYIVGACLVAAVVFGAWYLRVKNTNTATIEPTEQPTAIATQTPGPITKLSCDKQYYNPKIGFPEYYLSVEGGDVSGATNVTCIFTIRVDEKIVATETASSTLTDMPERGGKTFRCTTKSVELKQNIPTVVDVALKDDLKASSTCSATFTFAQ